MSLPPIDLDEIAGRPGAAREVALRGSIPRLATELAEVVDPVAASLRLEWVTDGVLVTGRLDGVASLRCARCLTPFSRPFDVELAELVTRPPAVEDDDYVLDEAGRVDPEPLVRDAIGVELPFAPLCRPDCLGLCEVCGADRNTGACPGHERTDPRWEGLDALLAILDD